MFISLIPYAMFALGLVLVTKGGDWFVDAAVWMAKITGIPQVIIGATIVSLATTLPELMVSLIASIKGHPDMAVGNAVGSINCNIGLVLGLTTLISPCKVESRLFNLKGFLMVMYTLILFMVAWDGSINSLDPFVLLLLLIIFIVVNISLVRSDKKTPSSSKGNSGKLYFKVLFSNSAKFILGIGLIVLGADLLTKYGSTLARLWGIPEGIIALTLIAIGTSLPELITSVSALLKGHKQLSIGNVVGANILNISMVLGLPSLFSEIPVTSRTLSLDLPVAVLLAILLVIPPATTKTTLRTQSGLLLALYIGYILMLAYIYL